MSVLLQCTGLTKRYGNLTALDGVDLTLESGKIIGLLGPNGAGKTTLIKIINGLLTPTSGGVRICGEAPGPKTKAIVSYLPDVNYLYHWMSVEQIVAMFADFYQDFRKDLANEMLDRLGVDRKAKLKTLSKGNKEKMSLILVMSRAAKLYILDEPLGGVDPATRDYILDTILNNFCEGASVLLSTHLIADIERILDDVLFIDNGRLVLQSPADELRTREGGSVDQIFRRMFKC